jgi:hypothetical protein
VVFSIPSDYEYISGLTEVFEKLCCTATIQFVKLILEIEGTWVIPAVKDQYRHSCRIHASSYSCYSCDGVFSVTVTFSYPTLETQAMISAELG